MLIDKADGSIEEFDQGKLEHSLEKAGVNKSVASRIAGKTKEQMKEGMGTSDVYYLTSSQLKGINKIPAARYAIRRALLELGPSGFPFENFVAEIYKAQGFTTTVGVPIEGKCGRHEIDVVAHKKEQCVAIEAKFHNKLGTKSDLKDVLYVKARADDVVGVPLSQSGAACTFSEGLLITNTKFTKNARHYATCVGLLIISWNHPKKGGLYDLIAETGVYPVTCLTSLTKVEKQRLIENHVALCKSVPEHRQALADAGISKSKIPGVIEESRELCSGSVHVE